MIKDRSKKFNDILDIVKTPKFLEFDSMYGTGPPLYFYKKTLSLRGKSGVESFLKSDYHIELLYATLVAWGMHTRAAKMKDFEEFKCNILSCTNEFKQLENLSKPCDEMIPILQKVYENLKLMKGEAKLVSNSKLLHFLFPEVCMPVDGTNTLMYLYGNTNEDDLGKKYIEAIQFSFELMKVPMNWDDYLKGEWNTTIPKVIDNAIIMLKP